MSLIIHRESKRGRFVVHDIATDGKALLRFTENFDELISVLAGHFEEPDELQDLRVEIAELEDELCTLNASIKSNSTPTDTAKTSATSAA